jgi:hypothetical protein
MDARAFRPRIRQASQSHAFDSPVPGEYKEVRTARPDEEYPGTGGAIVVLIYCVTTSAHAALHG